MKGWKVKAEGKGGGKCQRKRVKVRGEGEGEKKSVRKEIKEKEGIIEEQDHGFFVNVGDLEMEDGWVEEEEVEGGGWERKRG